MTKWEYGVLTGVSAASRTFCLYTHYPRLYRFTSTGIQLVKEFNSRIDKNESEANAVARTIFQLGEEGWELVMGQTFGDSYLTNDNNNLWFKREKSE
jgi:hypothetical protein